MIYLPLPSLRLYDRVTVTIGPLLFPGEVIGVNSSEYVEVRYEDTITDPTDGGTITLERVLPIECVRMMR